MLYMRKDIKGQEWKYLISTQGEIKSIKKNIILKQQISKKWYCIVQLFNKWKKSYRVHRLVAIHFIPNPENKLEVNHLDWDKLNNTESNLEWSTHSENQKHRFEILWQIPNMTWRLWKESPNHKKVNQYTKKWDFIKTWDTITDAANYFSISKSHIVSCCKKRRSYKSIWGYKWEYFIL